MPHSLDVCCTKIVKEPLSRTKCLAYNRGMVATASQEHVCLDCRRDISDLRRDAQRCKVCAEERDKELKKKDYWDNRTVRLERAKNNYQENRSAKLQYAKNRQQTPEAKQKRQEWEKRNQEKLQGYRQDQKQKHREKTGYNPEGRTCEKCGADISDRGHNAKWCVPCSTPPPRKCIACHRDISRRGSRAQFCNDECKQRHQQSKELQGYTKTCTKCNMEKQHTEFGLHYGLRRSVCKSCEASAVREYSQALPVEERQRRRRIQGRRERDKEANLPPEEKAMLRAKRRKAHRRSLYGTDFDENRLYSEQEEGKCAICGRPKPLELDHDHGTNMPRGLPL